jgi:hypothetical protein
MLGLGIQLPWRQQALGIPRSGLVCWHDLYDPTESLASVPDLSGNGYDLQLGSTAGADTNDPAWGTDGKGLVFLTDDYALTGNLSGVTAADDWTVIFSTTTNSNGYYWAIAASITDYCCIRAGSAGNLRMKSSNSTDSSESLYLSIIGPTVVVGQSADGILRLFCASNPASIVTCSNISTAVTAKIWLMSLLGAVPVAESTVYSHLFYNRALSDVEIQRIYRSLKATWAARGVTIL